MRAALLEAHDSPLVLDDIQMDGLRPGEVRVRVSHCGVCHSDLSAVDGSFPVPVPIVLGHEAAGVVVEVGPHVERLAEGDEVVLTPSPPCGRCYYCLRGQPGICERTTAMMYGFAMPDGSTRLRRGDEVVHRGLGVGAFADEVVTTETGAVAIPEGVPLDRACLIGCGVQTGVGAVINAARVEAGATVLVIGLGGVGMSVVQGARLAGAARIIASDPLESRRDAALGFGATDLVDPTEIDLPSFTRDLTAGIGVDYAFEVVGRSALVANAIECTRAGGTTVMVGAMPLDDSLTIESPVVFGSAEKRLIGCFLGSSNSLRDIPLLLTLWQQGRLDLDGLVTAERPLDEVNEAFADLRAGKGIRTVLSL